MEKIKTEWLTKKTGDPFTDVGGKVIQLLFEEKGHQDILKLIDEMTKTYVHSWNGKLNAFFLNSKITQPAFKGERKISETAKYFRQLINEELPFEEGYCRVLGVKTNLFNSGRDNNIMVGSGTFINFHHAFQNGLMLSKEAIIRLFFVPYGCVQLTDKVALLQSNDEGINKYFVQKNIEENQSRIGKGLEGGINRSKHKSPSSALFGFARNWIVNLKYYSVEDNVEMNLYHFTNFGASPEVVLYNFSAAMFKFYAKVQHRTLQQDWQRFANSYFKQKNAKYDFEKDAFELTENKVNKTLAYKDFRTWYNSIYESLILGKPILKAMLNWVFKKQRPLNFEIIKLYQQHIKNMNAKTLQIIEKIADYVLQDESSAKQNIRSLQKPTKAHAFRKVLLKLVAKNHLQRNTDPLFSMEEYALELFPDGTYWQEIQDLLLIALFQKMHERGIWFDEKDAILEELETETELESN
jgi:CRISPR-associated protein Cst1